MTILSVNKETPRTRAYAQAVAEARAKPQTPPSPDPRAVAKVFLATSPTWRDKRPLTIGFHKQALAGAPEGVRTRIRKLIAHRCSRGWYLKLLAQGGPRFDWHGKESGVITPEQQVLARERVDGCVL